MTERIDLFTTPLLQAQWPAAGEHEAALTQAINEQRQKSGGVLRSNIGGWHSDTDMALWGGPSAIALASFATEVAGEHMTDIHPRGKRSFNWSVEMWANINPPGAANQQHCHPGSLWSAIYHLDPGDADVENGGSELVLEDPRFPTSYMTVPELVLKTTNGSPMAPHVSQRPQKGTLIVFPSWLRHAITQHRGQRPYMFIGMNMMVGLANNSHQS